MFLSRAPRLPLLTPKGVRATAPPRTAPTSKCGRIAQPSRPAGRLLLGVDAGSEESPDRPLPATLKEVSQTGSGRDTYASDGTTPPCL